MQNGALRAPTLPIAASLILPAKLMIYRENPAKNPSLVKMLVYSVMFKQKRREVVTLFYFQFVQNRVE
jgi:hypothetical protein